MIGASASGVQIADELNRAGPRGVPRGRPAHPDAAPLPWHGHLLVAGGEPAGWRGPSTRSATRRRPGGSRRCNWRGRAGELDLVTLQANGVRLLGRFEGMEGTRARFRPDLAENAAEPTYGCIGCSTQWTTTSPVPDYRRGSPGGRGRRPSWHRRQRALWTCPVRASPPSWSPPATGPIPWLRLPVIGPDGHIRQNRGVTAAPGVYVVGQRFQYRRDSAFIGGARHDAAAVVQHLLTGRIAGPGRTAAVRSRRHDRVRRTGRRRTGRRVASTAMLLARAGARVALVERSAYGSDTVSTHGLMRAGVMQLARWGLLDEVAAAGTPPIRQTTFHYTDRESEQLALRSSGGVDALYAPRRYVLDRVLADAAADAGVEMWFRTPVTAVLRDESGRVDGRSRAGSRAPGRDHGRCRRHPFDCRVREVGAPVVRRGQSLSAILYRYCADARPTGYEWAYGSVAEPV